MNDVAAKPPTAAPAAAAEQNGAADRFIPMRYRAFAQRLLADFRQDTADDVADAVDAERLRDMADLIYEVVRQEADGFREVLVEHYECVNPERAAAALCETKEPETSTRCLLSDIAYLFERAGFEVVTGEMFQHAVREWNVSGVELHVDFSKFDHVMMFGRGRGTAPINGLGFLALYETTVVVPVFRRLAVVLKRKDDPNIHIRMFRDVPLSDLEAVLPGADTCMRPADKFWLGTTILSAGYTLLSAAGVDLGRFELSDQVAKAVAIYSMLGAYRVYYYYTVLRDLATGRLNKQLYYQQLNGNVGLLSHLIDETAQQEANMILAAYLFLLRSGRTPAGDAELDALIEQYLTRTLPAPVNFDVATAIAGLRRLRLAMDGAAPAAVPLDDAVARLREHVLSRRTRGHHSAAAATPRGWVDIIPKSKSVSTS